jgi:methionine sulfoxide reductase heme-binding subunit
VLATLTWYVSRASGVIAYVLLGASVLFGLMMSTRLSKGRPSLPWLLDVHRMLSGVGVALIAVHVVSILADTFVGFSVVDVLVPFASGWRTAALAAGIVAMYLLIAVEVTSLLRSRLRARTWRRVHALSFAVFVLTSIHFAAAGTDSASPLSLVLLVGIVSAVLTLTTYRIVLSRRRRPPVAAAPSPLAARPRKPGAVATHAGVTPPPRPARLQHSGGHPAPRRQPDRANRIRDDRNRGDLHRGVRVRPTP